MERLSVDLLTPRSSANRYPTHPHRPDAGAQRSRAGFPRRVHQSAKARIVTETPITPAIRAHSVITPSATRSADRFQRLYRARLALREPLRTAHWPAGAPRMLHRASERRICRDFPEASAQRPPSESRSPQRGRIVRRSHLKRGDRHRRPKVKASCRRQLAAARRGGCCRLRVA
jgi:hypothetical protein